MELKKGQKQGRIERSLELYPTTMYALYSNIVIQYISLFHKFCCSKIKFLFERWVRFPVSSLYEAIFVTLTSCEHAVCPLSRIKRPLVGGWFTLSSIVNSISAIASVHCTEVVRWREGPLWEVPLYTCT